MLYDITLRISYAFGEHRASGRQIVRAMPKDLPGRQRVVAAALDFQPRPSERIDSLDFFGNAMVEATFQNIWQEIGFALHARVKRTVEPPSLDLSPKVEVLAGDIERYRRLDSQSPHHFAGDSPRIVRDAAITRYAQQQFDPAMTVFEAVRAVNEALYRDMRFDADATDVRTPAGSAFAHRHGVCQDFAHIMITALRASGIPAAYVSGFLRTRPPEGKPRLEGADAMHAWVSAWCGYDAGWVEFDPTNGVIVANDHIVVAIGRDYGDVAPVSGVLKTTGTQDTDQAVDVVPLDGA